MQKEKEKTSRTKIQKKETSLFSSILSNEKKKTILLSLIGTIAIIVISLQINMPISGVNVSTFGFVGGIIVGVVPYAMLNLKQVRRRDSIDRNLPIFLLALISAVQSGQSLIRALEEAADRNMGALTPELKNLRANLSWGMPIEEAFDNFNKRVATKLARRVTILLQLAIDVGGDTVNTLEIIQKHVSELQNIEKERKAQLQPYIFTIYISFAVFLVITIILVSQFFTQIELVQNRLIESAQKTNIPLGMFANFLGIHVKELNKLMLNMSIVEAIFGGLAAGKIGEGSFVAGIKHIVIMVVLAVVGFTVVLK